MYNSCICTYMVLHDGLACGLPMIIDIPQFSNTLDLFYYTLYVIIMCVHIVRNIDYHFYYN